MTHREKLTAVALIEASRMIEECEPQVGYGSVENYIATKVLQPLGYSHKEIVELFRIHKAI